MTSTFVPPHFSVHRYISLIVIQQYETNYVYKGCHDFSPKSVLMP